MNDASTFTALLATQLTDPFRMGLMAALLFTTLRNAAVTGLMLPFAAGIVFVAGIIAMSFPQSNHPVWMVVVVGIVANAIIGAIMVALWRAFRAFQK